MIMLVIILGFALSLIGLSTYYGSIDRNGRVVGLLMLWGGLWLGIIGSLLGQ